MTRMDAIQAKGHPTDADASQLHGSLDNWEALDLADFEGGVRARAASRFPLHCEALSLLRKMFVYRDSLCTKMSLLIYRNVTALLMSGLFSDSLSGGIVEFARITRSHWPAAPSHAAVASQRSARKGSEQRRRFSASRQDPVEELARPMERLGLHRSAAGPWKLAR